MVRFILNSFGMVNKRYSLFDDLRTIILALFLTRMMHELIYYAAPFRAVLVIRCSTRLIPASDQAWQPFAPLPTKNSCIIRANFFSSFFHYPRRNQLIPRPNFQHIHPSRQSRQVELIAGAFPPHDHPARVVEHVHPFDFHRLQPE